MRSQQESSIEAPERRAMVQPTVVSWNRKFGEEAHLSPGKTFFHGVKASSLLARQASLWKSQFRTSIGLKSRQLGSTTAETYLIGIVALQVQSRTPMFLLGRTAQHCPREEKERNG